MGFFILTEKVQASSSVYWGAYIRGSEGNPTYPTDYRDVPYDMRTLDLFEANAGKNLSIVHFGIPWKLSSGTFSIFPSAQMTAIRSQGAIPMLNWGSWQLGQGVNQPLFKLTNINNGNFDTYITQWARDAKTWGYPFFIRLNHEMNIGGQFSWNFSDTWTDPTSGITYKNTANDYINMWKHVVDIFRREGANNVTWVWCPNIYFRSGSNALPFMQAYPGNDYVDWNCVDGYNKSTNMTPFSALFNDSYRVMQEQVVGVDTNCSSLITASNCHPAQKPIMIGEWASVEAGDDGTKKANWITDALLTQLPTNFPAIKAVVWFNWNTANGLIIESTTKALNAFKISIGNSYYSTNLYGNLPVGTKVQPPSSPPPSSSPTSTATPQNRILGDINMDQIVNILDFQHLANAWGSVNTSSDLNNDGVVNILDFNILKANFGRTQ